MEERGLGVDYRALYRAQGLPLGMQFVGRYADEATLYRLAAQLESARPWIGRRPELFG